MWLKPEKIDSKIGAFTQQNSCDIVPTTSDCDNTTPIWQQQVPTENESSPKTIAPKKQPPPFMQKALRNGATSSSARRPNHAGVNGPVKVPKKLSDVGRKSGGDGDMLGVKVPEKKGSLQVLSSDASNLYRDYVNYPFLSSKQLPTEEKTAINTVSEVTAAFSDAAAPVNSAAKNTAKDSTSTTTNASSLTATGNETLKEKDKEAKEKKGDEKTKAQKKPLSTSTQQNVLAALQLPPSICAKVDKIITSGSQIALSTCDRNARSKAHQPVDLEVKLYFQHILITHLPKNFA